jgi:aromatic-L-amino-acid/L-tryptophan decarboxylase
MGSESFISELMVAIESLEEAAAEAANLLVEIVTNVESRPISRSSTHAELAALFHETLQQEGIGVVPALREFRQKILPHTLGIPHALYCGLVQSSPLPGAVLADLLVSAVNNNVGAFHQGPAFLCAEEEVLRSFRELFGLKDPWTGMVLPGGTMANLQGIVMARTAAFADGVPRNARFYVSEAAHFSLARAARVAGLANQSIISIPTSGRGLLDVDALARQIGLDKRRGKKPFAVAASLGATGTGAIDPLHDIAALCVRESIWLHVDACYGGAAILLPNPPGEIAALRKADSIAIDPQKWFFIPIVAAIMLHRHPRISHLAFGSQEASYIPLSPMVEPWQTGIPTSRRATGFTIWMALRAHGWRTIADAVSRNVMLTRLLEDRLRDQGFNVLPKGELSVACARYEPQSQSSESLDKMQECIAREICESGRAWLATVRHGGKTWLRFNIVNFRTSEKHVDTLMDLLVEVTSNSKAEVGKTS